MMFLNKLMNRPQMDANMAQNTNALPGAAGLGGMPQRRSMMSRMMFPMMMGLDFNDPMALMMMGGF